MTSIIKIVVDWLIVPAIVTVFVGQCAFACRPYHVWTRNSMHVLWLCSTKISFPLLNCQLHSTSRTHLALAHISLFLASVPFFSGPLPCLHLSDPVITADPSLDLSTAKEITPEAAEHIGLPVWRGGGRGGLPDPLMLINWPRLWGFKKVPSGMG